MRRSIPLAALVAAIGLAACDGGAPTSSPEAAAPLAARSENAPIFLVTFEEGVDVRATAEELARGNGFGIRFLREHAAKGFSAAIPEHRVAAIAADPRVKLVERDAFVQLIKPVEIAARPGGGGGTSGQTTPWGITRVGGAADGTGKTAWVLDTGVDLTHPDLNTSRACHTYFAGTSPSDGNGHGTHVAGTIAAKNNAQDVVGVAAGAYVCSVRVLGNSGSGSYEGIVNGINFVAANGRSGDVANVSITGYGANATLENAVAAAARLGIRFVLAAGNSGQFAGNETPARLDATNVYTISATDSKDCLASFSNWGNPPIDYAAPGVGIVSTRKGGGTTSMSGTSMAAPHVAGILLVGSIRASGSASCDPDGKPDPIASR
ncbi:MAG TPA: S8 family serine peptidase [Longimicrobium sp.]|nr:S8 family serine peptidase [Longimicrobium sp.]